MGALSDAAESAASAVDAPRHLGAGELARLLDYPSLVRAMGHAFVDPIECPPRLTLDRGDGTMLVMAAARAGGAALVKTVTVGRSGLRSRATVFAADGRPLAELDGETLTARRTAAASVCAAALLADPAAIVLAVVGAGRQAAAQARAFAACRPIRRIVVWARRPDRAGRFAASLARDTGLPVTVADDLAQAVRAGDIVTVATRSETPLVRSADVQEGTHVDLVGGFRPSMREADDALIGRASLWVDTRQALVEAGDLTQPIATRHLAPDRVRQLGAALAEPALLADRTEKVSVFKSVGFAALDLVAAELALDKLAEAAR